MTRVSYSILYRESLKIMSKLRFLGSSAISEHVHKRCAVRCRAMPCDASAVGALATYSLQWSDKSDVSLT